MFKLIEVKELRKYYPITKGLLQKTIGVVKAVDGVSFYIEEGETFGLAGESGSGKSTLARVLLMLEEPTGGSILYKGEDIAKASKKRLRELRKEMQIVFQDPHSSLDPRMRIGDSIGEAFIIHGMHNAKNEKETKEKTKKLLELVGLSADFYSRYPHQLSGGEKQRICIARALAVEPKFIVCDEAVSALDVSVQAQILKLLSELQKKFNLTYLFISHNLEVVRAISKRIAIMQLGKIVELEETEKLFRSPRDVYTKLLLSSIPVPDPGAWRKSV